MTETLITLDKYEIINNEDGSQVFKIYYTNKGDSLLRLRIEINDLIFRTTDYNIGFHDIYPHSNYWSTFNSFDNGLTTNFSMGVFVKFIDENNSILHSEEIPFIVTDYKRRSLNVYSNHIPNMWIIGDSNVGVVMKGKEIVINNIVINWISHLFLSINRFIKSDWKSFLKTIPIQNGDILSFMLGEIDLRVSCGRNAKLKKIDPSHNLNRILNKYYSILKEIKKIYPHCNIVVMAPNPPIRDGILDPNSYLGIYGDENERLILWKQFDSFFYNEDIIGNIRYLNCMDLYSDDSGYMKTDLLNEKDSHVKDGEMFIKSLSDKILFI